MRKFLGSLAMSALLATSAWALSAKPDNARDLEVAKEYLELELAGWRLPDPNPKCADALKLKHVKVKTYGNNELADAHPMELKGSGPHYKITSVKANPDDASMRKVQFEILRKGSKPESDWLSFTYNQGDIAALGETSMIESPSHLFYRSECKTPPKK